MSAASNSSILKAVSYTHLDVYKRQVHDEALTAQAIAAREAEENGLISLDGNHDRVRQYIAERKSEKED